MCVSEREIAVNRWQSAWLGCIVEHLLGQQLLQPAVLVLQSPQSAGLRHIQPTELRLPLIEGRPLQRLHRQG